MMTPQERYMQDPVFHALVQTLRSELAKGAWTPTELREAVMLAATAHEAETVRPMILTRGEARTLGLDPEERRP